MPTFRKSERLCSQKVIDQLFLSGKKMLVFPFSIHWCECEYGTIDTPAQVLIATSKRKLHHAVDRNRVKRLMRECYRLSKPQLYNILQQKEKNIYLSINYIHNKPLDFHTMQAKYAKVLDELENEIGK